jgi:two-component system chemotaxis sensor kinase CheA
VGKDFNKYVPSGEMAAYLQMYLDETGEQLEVLVEVLLALEKDTTNTVHVNEAFRLVHTIKGSAALMGFENITELAHTLESQLDQIRTGQHTLERPLMDLSLRCVDWLRECNRLLRDGQALSSAQDLVDALRVVHGEPPASKPAPAPPPPPKPTPKPARVMRPCRVVIRFESGLPLLDLKAELAIARLAEVGTVLRTLPAVPDLARLDDQTAFQVLMETDRPLDEVRQAADVAGVALIELDEGAADFLAAVSQSIVFDASPSQPSKIDPPTNVQIEEPEAEVAAPVAVTEPAEAKAKLAETVRVDIERLDNLMNLAGELVVNKARFVQVARQMYPAFKKSSLAGRVRAFGEAMRRALHSMRDQDGQSCNWSHHLNELEAEIGAIEEQAKVWEDSRRHFGHVTEAIDQLSRVSNSLQRGVLDTRMVPVAPLFNRFKRVVRDISLELGKNVRLEIKGEKTELDKRMIDELGDPLIHLVRNSIDHGIEPADVRARRGKPAVGTICLEAVHSGNSVFIHVRDDGGGINLDKIRQRAIERGLVAPDGSLSEQELIQFIWHPGFSTAETVSDISGRGVGMDIVKTRIAELNGAIEIKHKTGQGTTFIIRLPLTLAIIRSLLFRVPHGTFAAPIDNVREIVSVPLDQIISVHGRQTFEVRREFIPLIDIADLFAWPGAGRTPTVGEVGAKRIDVVILQASNKTMGLKVNELMGSQDIVIKSLSENFIPIRGLSGASILGDGSVSLLLDVSAAIEMAGKESHAQ